MGRRRLTRTDVKTICEMQSKIDYYERFIHEVATMCRAGKIQFILEDKYSDGDTGDIYWFVRKRIEEDSVQKSKK